MKKIRREMEKKTQKEIGNEEQSLNEKRKRKKTIGHEENHKRNEKTTKRNRK